MEQIQSSENAVTGLIHRLIPQWAERIAIESLPSSDGCDVFEIESDGIQLHLRGSSGVAQASALNWFLKYHCDCHVSWESNQLNLPRSLPKLSRSQRRTPYRHRYYFNYCTFSYTTAFWDWGRWEREIDWMALNGINLPLAVTGQEAVWQNVLRKIGLTDAEVKRFLVGPALLPFGWMGCLDGWGGPLPDAWITGHVELQRQILQREREFGMKPVLQGFTGHVPAELGNYIPVRQLHTLHWAGFETKLLDPLDPSFTSLAQTFLEEQTALYGTDHLYAADTFIEMTPPDNHPEFLAKTATAIYEGMHRADPEAIWVHQGWPFYFQQDFWQPPQVAAFLNAIPNDRMIILDLFSEQHPFWRETKAFHGKPWIWCMLHNFGGRPGLFGNLSRIATDPPKALADPESQQLSGLGLTMEAIEQNSVVYELMTEMAWHDQPVDAAEWIQKYVRRRYGAHHPSAEGAWKLLFETVYSRTRDDLHGAPLSLITRRPSLSPAERKNRTYYPDYPVGAVEQAWSLLIDAAEQLNQSDALQYDLIQVGAQVLANRAADQCAQLVDAWRARDASSFRAVGDRLLTLIRDLDLFLATRRDCSLDSWLAAARAWATNDQERQLYEWNARTLVTLWGSSYGQLNDYAGKHWAGLVGGFYRHRWERFIDQVEHAILHGQPFDEAAFHRDLAKWEEEWTHAAGDTSVTTEGETIAIARALQTKYI